MRKAFKYRIYPSRRQATLLRGMLDECRWLYNFLLASRKDAHEQGEPYMPLYEQALIPGIKKGRPELGRVHSQVLQNVAVRIDRGFQAFFRRVKAGEKPGYPRFRGHNRYNSICYPQSPSGCRLVGNTLHLSKVGPVRVVLHRPLEGTPKTVTISRSSTVKWYVSISCEWQPVPLPPSAEQVGIDVGLKTFATLSTGQEIPNPRFFRQEERALVRTGRLLSKQEKGTAERARRRRVVARVHERTAWRRDNFAHQHSRAIVNKFGLISVEGLNIVGMLSEGDHRRSKSISDAAWRGFRWMLAYKAAWAGRKLATINPAYTSQTCSACHHLLPLDKRLTLSDRVFPCPECGLRIDRDLNASLNILRLGIQSLSTLTGKPLEAAPL